MNGNILKKLEQLGYQKIIKLEKKFGQYIRYHINGVPWENGLKDGLWKMYYPNGKLRKKGSFKNEKKMEYGILI